jgi:hypothetical protein
MKFSADLTGCSFKAQLRKDPLAPGLPALEFAFDTSELVLGKVVMYALSTQLAGLAVGRAMDSVESKYWWDLQMTNSLGQIRPVFHGPVNVLRRVTL